MTRPTALLACLAGLLAGSAAASGERVDITYAGGLLTIHCADAELADVLGQIGSAIGMTLVLDDAVKGTPLSADIEGQTVQAALERLLEGRGVSYAMSLSPDGQKVAQMFVGTGTEAKSASGAPGGGRPHTTTIVAGGQRPPDAEPPAAAHAPGAAGGLDDDEEIDAEADDVLPLAGLTGESVPGLPTSLVPAGNTSAPSRTAAPGTPPVPVTFPGSTQQYYPVLDPFGRPIPMPQPTPPAPPVEQKPAGPATPPVNQ